MSSTGAILIAHLSDLHLRDAGDVTALDRQLERIASRTPAHLAVTGDLLDRWDPVLLGRALDAFAAHGFRDAHALTILHGNHDFASSGGHPRQSADLWRLALRFWDPPPLIRARMRAFYDILEKWSPGTAAPAPFVKAIGAGIRIAVLDSVPVPWRPLTIQGRTITVQHAIGCIRERDRAWLGQLGGEQPLVVLVHHYPLEARAFSWRPDGVLRSVIREVLVPMAIPAVDRDRFWTAAAAAQARLVLCGHVHRARLEWKDGIAIGLNGQSGAEWAGRSIAFYEVGSDTVTMSIAGSPDQNR